MGRKFIDSRPNITITGTKLMQVLGYKIFGATWSDQDISAKASTTTVRTFFTGDSESSAHRKQFVQRRIIEALADGILVASVAIPTPDWAKLCYDAWKGEATFLKYFSSATLNDISDLSREELAEKFLGRRQFSPDEDDDEFDKAKYEAGTFKYSFEELKKKSVLAEVESSF